jgi:hypothetical protein
MVIKIENLEQLLLDFKESFVDKHEVKYYDFNEILEVVNERVLEEWNLNQVSVAFTVAYREDSDGNLLDSNCIFLLTKFERSFEQSDDDMEFTYLYNGTISG